MNIQNSPALCSYRLHRPTLKSGVHGKKGERLVCHKYRVSYVLVGVVFSSFSSFPSSFFSFLFHHLYFYLLLLLLLLLLLFLYLCFFLLSSCIQKQAQAILHSHHREAYQQNSYMNWLWKDKSCSLHDKIQHNTLHSICSLNVKCSCVNPSFHMLSMPFPHLWVTSTRYFHTASREPTCTCNKPWDFSYS